jgi:uncharacterized membrane protein
MNEEFFKIVGIIIVVGYLIYLAVKSMSLQGQIIEGLTNPSTTNDAVLGKNSASGAQDYANAINKMHSKISDSLLIKDNRTSYENVVIQLDDLINASMLKHIMSVNQNDLNDDTKLYELVDRINKMNDGKKSLNTIMKYIDSV